MQHTEQQFVLLSDVESDHVRMTCSCAAVLVRVALFGWTPASHPPPRCPCG
jgi:hypothetical protein